MSCDHELPILAIVGATWTCRKCGQAYLAVAAPEPVVVRWEEL